MWTRDLELMISEAPFMVNMEPTTNKMVRTVCSFMVHRQLLAMVYVQAWWYAKGKMVSFCCEEGQREGKFLDQGPGQRRNNPQHLTSCPLPQVLFTLPYALPVSEGRCWWFPERTHLWIAPCPQTCEAECKARFSSILSTFFLKVGGLTMFPRLTSNS